ncbi:MAG: glycosyltransferase [Chloroflexi bacterium]|nr:glycosyltransferase [Chloroflexota bacterium]
MTMEPRVSFVVPCYNYGHFAAQALDSLLDQTVQDIEIIAIDDASTDGTGNVLARYQADSRVHVIRHERNQGHIATYNEGLALARGRYVGLLSADDFCLRPDALAQQIAIFEAHPSVGLVYTAFALVEQGQIVRQVVPWPDDCVRAGLDEFRSLMWGNYVHHSGTLLRREVQMELGPYDPRLPHPGDWDMWLRAAARHDVGYLAQPSYAYRVHRQNMHHQGIPPWEAAAQNLLTIERAFAALPDDAPAAIRGARRAVHQHALLQTAWFDLDNGRRARTWQGLGYALQRQPALALGGEFWRFVPRLLLMTSVGQGWYRRTMAGLDRLRGRGLVRAGGQAT